MVKPIHIKCGAKAEVPETGPAKLSFQGYSGDSVNLSDYGFDAPVVYKVAGIETKQSIPILYDHKDLVGHSTNIRKVDNNSALRGKGLASVPGPATDKVVGGMKNGFPWQASMGLRVSDFNNISFVAKGETITVNNRQFTGPIYVVNKSELIEMTVTGFGRDSNTSFEYLNKEQAMKIKNSVQPTDPKTDPVPPVPPTDPAPPAPPKIENKDPVDPPVDPTPPVHGQAGVDPQVLRALRLSHKHPNHFNIIEKGLSEGWDDERIDNMVQLDILNKNLPKPPSPGDKTGPDRNNFLLARMALSFGAKPETVEKKLGKEITEKAHDLSQMGIVELLVNVANAQGGNFNGHSDVENMCEYVKNYGYSSFDLPDFFKKVSDMIKEERWEINPPFAPTVCKEGSNKDFRITERVRLTGGDIWNEVAADGKLDLYGTGGQKKYQTSLTTYGSIFTATREEVINDDMGALTDLMDMMVEGATMIPDYQLGNRMINQTPAAATFWIDDDNSFDNTALTRANLSTAFNRIRQYTETKDKFNWNVMMNDRWSLIVSPNLEETAWEILKQDYIVGNTTANTIQGSKNFWFGKLDLKVFAQMANTSAFNSGSKFVGNTTWILWPSSKRFAPYEITYLRGQKKPVTQTIQLPATLLGFGIRGFWDVKINERERTAIERYTATA